MKPKNTGLYFLLGLLCFAALPVVGLQQGGFYRIQEPYFACPVMTVSNTVVLRHDASGKGHFGASRNGGRTHQGVDFLTPAGRPIFASKSGRVTAAGYDKGYGNHIELFHPDGLRTRYAHLSTLGVREGDWVRQGQTIAVSGKTGNALSRDILPHLHFEIRDENLALNPLENRLDPSITVR